MGYNEALFSKMLDDSMRPGIVHRLDKDTSGVLLVAKTPDALGRLSSSFANRQVGKTYLAICHGRLKKKKSRVENFIGRHPVRRKEMAIVNSNGKQAISTFTELAHENGLSLIEAVIETGRTHQIRVHLKSLSCPVAGDSTYGKKKDTIAERQMLHAWKLQISHPESKEDLLFTAELPSDFSDCLKTQFPDYMENELSE